MNKEAVGSVRTIPNSHYYNKYKADNQKNLLDIPNQYCQASASRYIEINVTYLLMFDP